MVFARFETLYNDIIFAWAAAKLLLSEQFSFSFQLLVSHIIYYMYTYDDCENVYACSRGSYIGTLVYPAGRFAAIGGYQQV